MTSKTSPPAPPNFSSDPPPNRAPEISSLAVAGKCARLAVQLLHGLLHFRALKLPEPEESGERLRLRAKELHRLSRALLGHLNVRHTVYGALPKSGLLVTNHLGFLDIMTLSALGPMVFVSKAEVERWPLVGDIASCAGTIYIERKRRTDVSRVNAALRRRLNAGLLITLFPEGTSSDGSSVLPFQPSLLQPAVDLGVSVTPAHIAYTGLDGLPAEDIAYFGERELGACLLALIRRREIHATMRFGNPLPPASDRKSLATELHANVSSLAS